MHVKFVCVTLMYVKLMYVKFLYVKFVCDCCMCKEAGGGGGAQDTESKTRTPHKVVGNKVSKVTYIWCIILYYIVSYHIILYHTILYYIILYVYYIILYYIVIYIYISSPFPIDPSKTCRVCSHEEVVPVGHDVGMVQASPQSPVRCRFNGLQNVKLGPGGPGRIKVS